MKSLKSWFVSLLPKAPPTPCQVPSITVRAWDDLYPYKKMYILQGFWQLKQKGQLRLELHPYSDFLAAGAPAPIGDPYYSHKNIVLLEIQVKDKVIKVIYDANDLYYKIPGSLLAWSDLYFKSNYQKSYLQSGNLLEGPFWNSRTFRPELVPDKLDTSQFSKFRPASFTMELYDSFKKNQAFLDQMHGLWHQVPISRKKDVFFLGRYWLDTKNQTLSVIQQINQSQKQIVGGIVMANDALPAEYQPYVHRPVGLKEWCKLSSQAKISLMTRGADGCTSTKPLYYAMMGSPFIANQLMSNFWQPVEEGVHYFTAKDDFSDLSLILDACSDEKLVEMGQANLRHWDTCLSPEATAQFILTEAQKLLE